MTHHLTARIADLEAENARLQEREGKVLVALAEALGAAATTPVHTDSPAKYVRMLAEGRDRYKALAERRGEALDFWLGRAGHGARLGHACRNLKCAEARAALAATPDEARICLVCGRDVPCELDTNKDNDPNWPGSPCTFDLLSREELDARNRT